MSEEFDVDFEFLYRLSSLYNAATLSATCPVTVPADSSQERVSVFSHVFWDCVDDERAALGMMRQRFRFGASDIRQHYGLHEKILKGFYDIDEGLNTRNRERVADAAQYLTTDVLQYGVLVSAHKAWAGAISWGVDFLDYPSCVPGHYFILPHCSEARVKSFNSEQTLEGVGEGFTAIVKLSNDFRIGSAELPDIKISEDRDTGEGIFDTSLRGRLELNKELLRRAGFMV